MDNRKIALETGMISLRRAGVLNIMRGVTSIEEVVGSTVAEEAAPVEKKVEAKVEEPLPSM